MSYKPLGGNLPTNRGHGKIPRVLLSEGPLPHCSQAVTMNAALENKVDTGLSQTQGAEDSCCLSPGRLPPPFTSVQLLPLFPELCFPQGPIQVRGMIKATIDEHFLCARHWTECSRPIFSPNSHHCPTDMVGTVPPQR